MFLCSFSTALHALGQLNWSTTAIASPRTRQRGEAPTSPDENQTGGSTLWQSVLTVATELDLRLVLWT